MNFTRQPDMDICIQPGGGEKKYFAVYQYSLPLSGGRYLLYKLKSDKECLLPEIKQLDFLLLVQSISLIVLGSAVSLVESITLLPLTLAWNPGLSLIKKGRDGLVETFMKTKEEKLEKKSHELYMDLVKSSQKILNPKVRRALGPSAIDEDNYILKPPSDLRSHPIAKKI